VPPRAAMQSPAAGLPSETVVSKQIKRNYIRKKTNISYVVVNGLPECPWRIHKKLAVINSWYLEPGTNVV
jgi:hypothetical protein